MGTVFLGRVLLFVVALSGVSLSTHADDLPANNPTPIPDSMQIRVTLEPIDGEAAKKIGLRLVGKPKLFLSGKWEQADGPLPPALYASFSFATSDLVNALSSDLREIPGVRSSDLAPSLLLHRLNVRIGSASTRSDIKIILQNGKVIPIPFRLELALSKPVVLADPDCADMGINAQVTADKTRSAANSAARSDPAITMVRCVSRGAALAIKMWSLNGYSWQIPTETKEGLWRTSTGTGVINGDLPLHPADGVVQQTQLNMFSPDQARALAIMTISHREVRPPTWLSTVGLGPTLAFYHETAPGFPDIQFTQLGLTAKAQLQYLFLPPHWDAAFNVFGTVASLFRSPDTLSSARWVGANLRLGYQILLDPYRRNTISILPGVYAWSMFVEGDQYGIQNLNGPQLVISASHMCSQSSKIKRIGGYLKFAMISEGFALGGLSNRELAIGGFNRIIFYEGARPLDIAIDISRLHYATRGFTADLSTFSFSLGTPFL